jgi:2-oxoglutarate dehydrogenase E1 component
VTRGCIDTLKAVAKAVTTAPEGFKVHPRVERVPPTAARWRGKLPFDRGMVETLARHLLNQDGGVRLSGEDTARGIFAPPFRIAR